MKTHVGNTDTLLDHIPDDNPLCDTGLTFAPGEGQRPISLYSDPDAEYLSFPTIFCGQRRPDNKERSVSVHYTDIVKWELRSMDRRVAQSVPKTYFQVKENSKAIEEAENDCNENDQIAPATQQVEMEDAEIGPTESEQYVHFNPDRPTEHRLYDMSREVGIEARTIELTNHANRISESDYFALIRSLNKKQWEFFSTCYHMD
ncbi:unnamed protein product [Mytilus coruscus]|uniref:Uncharacterized protein n=1 Tax=Mytilus coruscus TaxID=42192 RepID=A0A6J8E8I6_MYTCO|nr:unnamed protein product [Mytilus coruscus]